MKFYKYIGFALILIFLGMIYWSSLLVEEKVLMLEERVDSLELRLNESKSISEREENEKFQRIYIDESLSNLLQEDPFYKETLPTLLGDNQNKKGILREPLVGRPDNLHPFNNFRDISRLYSLAVPTLGEMHIGKFDKFAPSLALKIEERLSNDKKSIEYWVHLRDRIYWEPLKKEQFAELDLSSHFLKKHPVTAHDFKFSYDAVMNPFVSEARAASLRSYYSDIEEVKVLDDKTFVIRWKGCGEPCRPQFNAFALTCELRPLPSFTYKYFADGTKIIEDESSDAYRESSIWAQIFTNHFAKNTIVSCGAWIFNGMNDEGIKFTRNPQYFNPYHALSREIHFVFEASGDTAFQDFKAGKLDFCPLSPTQTTQFENFLTSSLYESQSKNGKKIESLDYVESGYTYIAWNQKSPFFSSNETRLALTYAIDRSRLITQNLAERAVLCSGPFHCFSPSTDPRVEAWPYAPEKAKEILEREGWRDLDGDGILEKEINGEKQIFRFSLIYYGKSPIAKSISEFVASELKKVGIDCRPCGLEVADLSIAFDDKSFEALYLGWALGSPPEDPKQLWHSSLASEKGSSNAIGFASIDADRIIEDLRYEYNPEKRLSLYHAFHRLIHESAPYTFLYFPKSKLLYRENVQNLFIPRSRPDLIPGAQTYEPDFRIVWVQE